jgi:RND family efflux transporter MFP subunit
VHFLSAATRHPWWLPSAVMLLSACTGCNRAVSSSPSKTAAENTDSSRARVDVITVAAVDWPILARAQGSLAADEVAVVGSKVAGSAAEVHVDLGDLVRTADPLVTLDQEPFRLELSQAEAQQAQVYAAVGLKPSDDIATLDAEQAPPVRQERALWEESQANLARARSLRPQNAITDAELEQIAAAERVAEARLASAINGVNQQLAEIRVRTAELAVARQRLLDAVIRAPFDGRVQQRHTAPGNYVQVGQPTVTIVRLDPLRFRGTLPERSAQRLAVGQEVRLRIESVPEPQRAQVSRISPSVDELSRSIIFEALVENPGGRLRAGLFVEAEVVLGTDSQKIAVPHSAVIEFAGAEKVWKLVDGVASEQLVTTGQRREDNIEIVAGLEIGDLILRDGKQGKAGPVEPVRIGIPREPATVSGAAAAR